MNNLQLNPFLVINTTAIESITRVKDNMYTIKMVSGARHLYIANTVLQQQNILRLISQG